MIREAEFNRAGPGWQLILADLALILFLLTLSALPAAEAEAERRLAGRDAREKDLRHGTLESLHTARRTQRAIVAAQQTNAAQVFAWAGELAPVFGLIGTLYAFTQLAPIVGGDTVRLTMQAISTAVLSTLYGALLAHLLCFPLATAITRRAARNESAREALAEWFIDQIAKAATLAQVRRAQLRGVA